MSGVDRLAEAAAAVPFAAAVVVAAVGLLRTPAAGRAGPAELAASLALSLEFLLAAGLLRLSALDDFGALAAVAAIVLLRKLITTGVRFALRALGAARFQRLRA
jgi:Protein of unknown function (DUF1622)